MTAPLLEIEGLSIAYGSQAGPIRALRDVALTLGEGRVLGVVGESGCGKSTLINAILRILPPNATIRGGRISLRGCDLLALSERAMQDVRGRRISVVLQDPMSALNPVIRIGRQMVNVLHRSSDAAGRKRDRAIGMLKRVGISDAERRFEQHPHELSGGMRQRVCIAMALLAEPQLLICDEPTTALDATLEVQILDLIRTLQGELGFGVLFISHHLGVIAELCDEVAVLYSGEVVEQAPVRDLFLRPRHPYTERLIACDPARIRERSRRLPVIEGTLPDLVNLPAGCVFRDRCHRAFEPCGGRAPAFHQIGPSHRARCHLAGDGPA